jgi:trigger factor
MNIKKENISDLHELITIELAPEDYQSQVTKSLKSLKQTLEVPGFRKNMAPVEIINKMHGKSIRGEEIHKLMNSKIVTYIEENNLTLFFSPILCEEKSIADFEKDGDFSFSFEIAICPEVKINYDDLKEVVFYKVVPTEEEIDEQIMEFRKRAGVFSSTEVVSQGDILLITVSYQEGENEKTFTTDLPLDYIKDEEQEQIIGKQLHEEIDIDTVKIFKDEVARSVFLKLKIEELETAPVNVHIKIDAIHHLEIANMDDNFFDRVFPDGTVTNETELRDIIKNRIEWKAVENMNLLYHDSIMKTLNERISPTLTFPDAFIKKYYVNVVRKYTVETIEENYDGIKQELIRRLIGEQINTDFDITVPQTEIANYIYSLVRQQYVRAQGESSEEQEEQMRKYTIELMKEKANITTAYENIVFYKSLRALKKRIDPTVKEISFAEFQNKLIEKETPKVFDKIAEPEIEEAKPNIEKKETNQ